MADLILKLTDTLILRVVRHTAAYLNMNVNLQTYKRARIELYFGLIGQQHIKLLYDIMHSCSTVTVLLYDFRTVKKPKYVKKSKLLILLV